MDEVWEQRIQDSFVFVRWKDQPKDFWGTGIPFDLIPLQLKIIEFINNISRALAHFSMPYMLVPKGSKPSREAFTNILARVVTYEPPNAPTIQAPQNIINQAAYDFVFQMKNEAFEMVGLNQMTAHGTKQPGIESGVAIRETNDIQTGRFATVNNEWDNSYVSLGLAVVECAKANYGKKSKVRLYGKGGMNDEVDWSEVDMQRDQYHCQAKGTNNLATSPAARREELQELFGAGLITKEEFLDQMGSSDIGSLVRLNSANYRSAQKLISDIVEKHKYDVPDQNYDVALVRKLAQETYLDLSSQDEPDEEAIELLDALIRKCKEMLQINAPPPQQPVPGIVDVQGQAMPQQPPMEAAPQPMPANDIAAQMGVA